jgi:hypothetical protein
MTARPTLYAPAMLIGVWVGAAVGGWLYCSTREHEDLACIHGTQTLLWPGTGARQ